MTLRTRVAAAVLIVIGLATSLTGCVNANPADETWTLIAKGDIIAIDGTSGVYVSGTFVRGAGQIESHSVLDYQYARAVKGGGIRQDLVSATFNRVVGGDRYPGSQIVTIYQDATPGGRGARIELYDCDAGGVHTCVMPDGSGMGGVRTRVDIHVPPNSVVQPFDGSSVSTPTPTPSSERR